jgi:hypothetical protein
MTWSDRSALYVAAAGRAQQAGNVEAFTDLIVAARACAAIERQIKRAERWLEYDDAKRDESSAA